MWPLISHTTRPLADYPSYYYGFTFYINYDSRPIYKALPRLSANYSCTGAGLVIYFLYLFSSFP